MWTAGLGALHEHTRVPICICCELIRGALHSNEMVVQSMVQIFKTQQNTHGSKHMHSAMLYQNECRHSHTHARTHMRVQTHRDGSQQFLPTVAVGAHRCKISK